MAGGQQQEARTGEDVDFDAFYRRAEPQVRRALVAAFGVTVGREAAAMAMSYGFEHWDRVRAYESPVGYLFQVGRSSTRTRRRPLQLVASTPLDDVRFDAELWDAVRRLPLTQGLSTELAVMVELEDVGTTTASGHDEKGCSPLISSRNGGRGALRSPRPP